MYSDSHQPDASPGASDYLSADHEGSSGITRLLHRVAQQDRKAFAELYEATAPKLLATVLRILKDRTWADDVIHDTYVKVWHKANQFDAERSSPITWLAAIARHGAIDELRRHPARRETASDELDSIADHSPTAHEQISDQQTVKHLNHCIDQLEKDRQDMVRLAYLNGWSRDQLAKHFDQPINTVKTWLHRALKQIKRCLEP
ncbi:sigma-70 family RNA polymerase sigma factor [Marinobacter shengliensis]|uniref:sigma-70 family RNA polymerase sigma factor n=1 Tax=Marinobacter shengliensis TaxID=1389223 RepID=UPI000D0EB612|nr:sigma-70 family RNA polymerase sigma factor [Marinobacter shengliensis]PSF12109.1 RNA polymerase subunit sigma-24 [Marinobacter shengliensis]